MRTDRLEELAVAKLKELPDPWFRNIVLLFVAGESVDFATGWLANRPELDESLTDWTFNELRKHLSMIRKRIRAWQAFPSLESAPAWLREIIDGLHKSSEPGGTPEGGNKSPGRTASSFSRENVPMLNRLGSTPSEPKPSKTPGTLAG